MTVATESTNVEDRSNDGYEEFSQAIRQRFTKSVASHKYLFTTDATGLFDAFLAALPDEARQHYTCNSCRRFVNTYGGLVTINGGDTSPAMWQNYVPQIFQFPVFKVMKIIYRANVTGVFLSGSNVLGTPITGEWHHMSVLDAPKYSNRLLTPFQAMAEKTEDYRILERSLHEFTTDTVEQAVRLLDTEALYRSEKCLGVAKWLLALQKSIATTKNAKTKANLIWLAVAGAPTGYAHIRSSMIGTLLEDIQSGMSFDAVASRFSEKMHPSNYQRSQVAPTEGGKQQAEQLVKKLGLENSLQRRYLSINEIPAFVWRRREVKASVQADGVFAGIATKTKAKPQSTAMALPVTTMTWRKFSETVLPTATKIEIKTENSNQFAALVTAVHPESENILQWNNGVSWYYHAGVDAEMRRRVIQAGGQYEDNEIRCSLMWNTYSDLDLHCITPARQHIYFGDKRDRSGGRLDVDENAGAGHTLTPVENIRWATAPNGLYQFYIHNYSERSNGQNWYKAEIEVSGKVFTFEGIIGRTGSNIDLTSFNYQKGVAPTLRGGVSASNGTAWNVAMNQYHEVTGIVKSPNLWGDNPVTHAGDHTFFLIDGCKDTEEGKGRGFFNEMLKPELREIRKTLEAYTASTPVSGEPTACGLGFSKVSEWNATVRVTSDVGVTEYKLDRWD